MLKIAFYHPVYCYLLKINHCHVISWYLCWMWPIVTGYIYIYWFKFLSRDILLSMLKIAYNQPVYCYLLKKSLPLYILIPITKDSLLSPGTLLSSEDKSLSRDILISILKISYYHQVYCYLLKINHCHVTSWYLHWRKPFTTRNIAIFWRLIIVKWYLDIYTEDSLSSPGILLSSEEKSLSRDILISLLKIAFYNPVYCNLLKKNHCHMISWYLYWR